MKDGSLVFVLTGAEPSVKPGTIYRPVVFDKEGKRYLPGGCGAGSSPNAGLSVFTNNFILNANELSAAKVQYIGIETKTTLWTPFEDFAQFNFGGGGTSGTGIRDKGGFTVVPMEAPKGRTKLCVSFAVKEERATPCLSDQRGANYATCRSDVPNWQLAAVQRVPVSE
jgi:hypothetical protein